MYPTYNLTIIDVCNLGGSLLSGIYDDLLCNLENLSKCVNGHNHGRLSSLRFANHVKFLDQILYCIEWKTRCMRHRILPV